jgi:ubiquinone/menaquinone biosynthesis C-methylase UbiE
MTTTKSQYPDDNLAHQEHYAHGYDTAMTLKLHTSRTAASHAAFFLPYLQPGMRLLDCGCGSGSITLGLAQVVAPAWVTGIDISEVEIERAQGRAAEEGVTNIHFEVGNLYKLAFPAQSFEAVFAHNVLEHVGEPIKALEEMHRVLKPGGVMGIRDVDMGGSLLAPADELVHHYLALLEAVWERAGGHPRLGRRLRGLLHEAGFVEVAASASYEVYGDPEGLRFISQIATSRCTEPDFVRQVVEHGLAGQERLEEIKAALHGWSERSDAFSTIAHCEVVGRKR